MVSARSLTKVYGRGSGAVKALDAVNVDIARARFTAIMGPSGSGKEQVARTMERTAGRAQDLVARYGGEEFAVLLPQLDVNGAAGVAQRMLAELGRLAIPHAASPTAAVLTASMGIAAVVPAGGQTGAALIRAADAALYEAKAAGRNRYRVAVAG